MSHFHPHSIDANNLHPSKNFIKIPSEATVRRYILQNMCSKKFCKFTGKYLCWSLFLIKVDGLRQPVSTSLLVNNLFLIICHTCYNWFYNFSNVTWLIDFSCSRDEIKGEYLYRKTMLVFRRDRRKVTCVGGWNISHMVTSELCMWNLGSNDEKNEK